MAGEPMPVLSRVEKLDLMMSYLEEIKGSNKVTMRNSSRASTTSSGTQTTAAASNSEGGDSSVNSSPERRCRPLVEVVMEARVKGSLIERVNRLEARLLKAILQMEEGIEEEKIREAGGGESPRSVGNSKKHKKGLKTLVKSCMRGKLKTKE